MRIHSKSCFCIIRKIRLKPNSVTPDFHREIQVHKSWNMTIERQMLGALTIGPRHYQGF